MARQGISTGTIPNDGTGDTLLSGAIKINENFSEVYGLIGDGTNAYVGIVTQIVAGSNVSISTSYGSVTVNSAASGSTSYWSENSTGIHTLSNVGIGTTTASSALTVSGDVSISGISTLGITSVSSLTAQQLNVSGVSTFSDDITFNGSSYNVLWDKTESSLTFYDGAQARFGSGGDLRIYHDAGGSHSYIQDTGTGELRFIADGPAMRFGQDLTETYAVFNDNGSVELYYDNSKKFETASNGISVTGIVTAISGIVTYYGDTSNAVDGRWILTGDGSNYTFTGIGITSGNNTDPKIYLARARVYEFVNTQPSSHPFVIRDSDGGTEWTAGVSTSTDGTNDILRFEVPMNAPNTLFYQCTVHSGMGNTITVYPTVS